MGNKLLDLIGEALFSESFTCFCCGDEIIDGGNNYLCDNCLKEIEFIKHACVKCGDKVNEFDKYCKKCKESPKFYFDANISVAKLEGLAKTLIYRLKFGGKKFIAKTFAKFMADKFNSTISDNIDYVCYVPITNSRRKERGYNQSEEIAVEFCMLTNLKLYLNLFLKLKDTTDQTRLNKKERTRNLKDVFFIQDNIDIKNKNFIIIDDVMTTGATINALSRLLKKKGAGLVYGLTFCHT